MITIKDTLKSKEQEGSEYILVAVDRADNEYQIATNRDTFKTVESLLSVLEDTKSFIE